MYGTSSYAIEWSVASPSGCMHLRFLDGDVDGFRTEGIAAAGNEVLPFLTTRLLK